MKKILLISTVALNKNGISSVIMQFIEKIDLSKYSVSLICNDYIDEHYKKKLDEKKVKCYAFKRKRNPLSYYVFLKKINKKNKYDIIHIHGNSATMFLETNALKNKNNKVIVHCHNTKCDHKIMNGILNKMFNESYDTALACSEEAGKWIYTKDFMIIPNCISTENYKFVQDTRNKKRKELGIKDNEIIIGHIGLMNEQKNHKRLIEIFRDYNKINQESKLLCITGTLDVPKNIKQQIDEFQLQDKVIILHNRNDVNELLQAMDVFVFPSLYEGFGIVLIEAQASGLLCVCSSEVPISTNVCNNNSYISLDETNEKWIEAINEKLKVMNNRKKSYQIIKNSVYDSSNFKKIVDKIYK